jgi:DNA polymerase-3 subunit epsilon
MGLDFVAIDFETAGPKRASVCQVGLAEVRDGQITKTACEMVKPPRGFTDFHPRNIQVHGLTPKSIYGAPGWPGILDRLIRFTGDPPLIGHNVAFEKSLIVQASEAEGLTAPDFQYLCSQKLAQAHLPEAGSFKLNTLAEHLGMPAFAHHNAGADAEACAALVLKIAEHTGLDDLESLSPAKPARAARANNGWRRY